MFAIPTFNVGATQRVVATFVAVAIVLWSVGAYVTAEAASLLNISDTLGDSDLSVTTTHTISFDLPTGATLLAAEDFDITFDAAFTVGAVALGNVTATVAGGGAADSVTTVGNVVTVSLDTVANAGDTIVVAIDDVFITNPGTEGSYTIDIDLNNTDGDSGQTRVAIINNVVLTARVDTVFNFNIFGTATGTDVHADTTTGSTSAQLIDFGLLVADTPEILAQRLTVETNADQGFVVTLETDGDLQSANGAVIDSFTDATDISTAGTAWTTPGDNIADEQTWGHWGITYEDNDTGGAFAQTPAPGDLAAASSYIAASTTPREVFVHGGPADAATEHVGSTTVGFQIEVTPLQEAADDYTTTLTYIATPTF